MPIKVVIIDDHPLATKGISSMLSNFSHIEVIGIYHSAQALLDGLQVLQPDIILLDILLPDKSGKELAPILKQKYPNIEIIALTSLDVPTMVSTMIRRGCKGYLLKDTTQQMLIECIEQVYQGKEFIEPQLKEKLIQNIERHKSKNDKQIPEITQREMEVLKLIAEEYTTQEIADKLFISFRTVENHRYSLLKKLDVKNTVGLIKVAIQIGLVSATLTD